MMMNQYRVTANNGKYNQVISAKDEAGAWLKANRNGNLYNGDVVQLPTRDELEARVELLEHKLLLISELSPRNSYEDYRAAVNEIIWSLDIQQKP
jgi:hypothetical protein